MAVGLPVTTAAGTNPGHPKQKRFQLMSWNLQAFDALGTLGTIALLAFSRSKELNGNRCVNDDRQRGLEVSATNFFGWVSGLKSPDLPPDTGHV